MIKSQSKMRPRGAPERRPAASEPDGTKEMLKALALVTRMRDQEPDYWTPYWNRIVVAARKGGCDGFDLSVIVMELAQRSGTLDTFLRVVPHAQSRMKALRALANKKSRVPDAERESVLAAARQLKSKHLKKTPLYRAVADELNLKEGRVRYILEGPRRAIRK